MDLTKSDIQKLEAEYLRAKIEYYEGNSIMSDLEFDALEQHLINLGSKVHEQVGAKRKDFDFPHPTKMLSLAKLQTEEGNYMKDEFWTWFSKRGALVGKLVALYASPKFDGSAINIIYRDGVLENILTRGDGLAGKNLTKRLTPYVPEKIHLNGIVEIRCEVVIDTRIFEKKYSQEFANARNFVAGVLGKDDYSEEKVGDLTLIPLHYIQDGIHLHQTIFEDYPQFAKHQYNILFDPTAYEEMIEDFEKMRKKMNYQLDGVVISYPETVREELGQNDHDPEWAIAIKFVPEGAVTGVNGIEWNIGKRGQFTPVVLLDPVQLAGTTVKRASGYNAGFIRDNGISAGAIVAVEKAGDIIPEIVKVISESSKYFELPGKCPECETILDFDGIHLKCLNEKCPGRIAKILAHGSGVLDLKGIGSERLKPFAKDFKNICEVWGFTLENGGDVLGKYGLEPGSRLNEIFVQAFKNVKSIPYEKVIQCLGMENVGRKISQQLAREHAGLDFSYASLEHALVDKVHTPVVEHHIVKTIIQLEALGVTVDRPEAPKDDAFGVVMTGSPKGFGFKTKKEFLEKYPNLFECSMSDATCKYLITDDLNSTSGKMKAANKKGIEIKTYGDF